MNKKLTIPEIDKLIEDITETKFDDMDRIIQLAILRVRDAQYDRFIKK
jgi:hypothetical protein